MSKLDLSKFKKVKSGPNHTVMRHPKGHEITIFHKDLSKPLKKQLDDLPHYVQGGIVDPQLASGISGAFGNTQDNDVNTSINRVETAKKKNDQQMHDSAHTSLNKESAYGYAMGGDVAENDPIVLDPDKVKQWNSGFNPPKPKPSPSPSTQYFARGGMKIPDSAQTNDMSVTLTPGDVSGRVPDVAPSPQIPSEQPSSSQLADMQSMANGPNFSRMFQAQDTPMAPTSDISKLLDAHSALVNHVTSQPQQSPMGQSMAQSPAQSGQPVPASQPGGSLTDQYNRATNNQMNAINTQGKNTAASDAETADIYAHQGATMQDHADHMEMLMNNIHHQFQKTSEAVEAQHIDPNQWWTNKSTGGKIATAIGMILGGLGGGAAGHPEQAVNIVDGFINRDIDAQKAELGKNQNLLSKYMEMYQSLPAAEAATRLTLQAGFDGQLKSQAAKLGSTNAIAAAQQASNALKAGSVQNLPTLAQGQYMMSMYQGMGNEGKGQPTSDPEQAFVSRIAPLEMIAPEKYKIEMSKYLPNVGLARYPVPDKARDAFKSYDKIENLVARAQARTKEVGTTMPGSVNDSINDEMRNSIITELNELHGLNRLNDNEFHTYMKQVPNPGAIRSEKAFKDFQELRNQIGAKRDVEMKSYGIKPFSSQSQSNTIRVKMNSTGQTGTITPSEFDPKIYTKVQ